MLAHVVLAEFYATFRVPTGSGIPGLCGIFISVRPGPGYSLLSLNFHSSPGKVLIYLSSRRNISDPSMASVADHPSTENTYAVILFRDIKLPKIDQNRFFS